MEKKYYPWIDALKGFGMILVTVGHLSPWMPIEKHIYSFHMCLFFFVSGFLFTESIPLKSYIKKKAQNIFFPFVVWNSLSTAFQFCLDRNIRNAVMRFFVIDGELCWNAPIWFLLILFFVECIYSLILNSRTNARRFSVLVLSGTLWVIWYRFLPLKFLLKLNLVPFALFCFALGDLSKFIRVPQPQRRSGTFRYIMGITNIVFGVFLNTRVSYTKSIFGNIYHYIIAAVSGTFFYFLLFKKWNAIQNSKTLQTIGKNSMIIMCTQYWFFRLYDSISEKLFQISIWHSRSTIKSIIVAAITMYIIISAVTIFKRIFKQNSKILKAASFLGIR